jgi:hypothetical protein
MAVEVGQQYETTATVTDRTGVLTAPATIHLNATLPDGTVTSLDGSIVNDGTGKYHADYTTVQEGLHVFVWNSIGPVTHKTDYANCNIFRSVIGIDEARAYVGYTEGDRDDIFRQVMAAATELAESIVGNCVQRVFTNERVPGYQAHVLKMPHAPLPTDTAITSITSVYAGGPSWVTADLIVYPDSGTVETVAQIPFYYGPWKATYTAGRLVVSNQIQLAVKEIIMDLWATQRPYGADSFEPGPEATAQFEQMLANYKIPPHAQALLESQAQPGFA